MHAPAGKNGARRRRGDPERDLMALSNIIDVVPGRVCGRVEAERGPVLLRRAT